MTLQDGGQVRVEDGPSPLYLRHHHHRGRQGCGSASEPQENLDSYKNYTKHTG